MKKVSVRLGDLRIGEEFETAISHHQGHVVGWGHVRPSGHWHRQGWERPRWPAVLCSVGCVDRVYSPDLVVLVERTRSHWRLADASPSRWSDRLVMA